MRAKILAALVLAMPAAVFADAMATAVTAFDAGRFKATTATNGIEQVRDGDLFTKSLVRGCYFGGKDGSNAAADFRWDDKTYRLLISRQDTRTVYTVLLLRPDSPPHVVAVGEIGMTPYPKPLV